MNTILIFLGGGLGAISRFGVSKLLNFGSKGFPWATFTVNLLGCFLIGILWYASIKYQWAMAKPLLVIGFLGGFTTFSSFGLETQRLIDQNAYLLAASYVLLSNILGVGLVYLGKKLIV